MASGRGAAFSRSGRTGGPALSSWRSAGEHLRRIATPIRGSDRGAARRAQRSPRRAASIGIAHGPFAGLHDDEGGEMKYWLLLPLFLICGCGVQNETEREGRAASATGSGFDEERGVFLSAETRRTLDVQ